MFLWEPGLYTDQFAETVRELMFTANSDVPGVEARAGRPPQQLRIVVAIFTRSQPSHQTEEKIHNHGGASTDSERGTSPVEDEVLL